MAIYAAKEHISTLVKTLADIKRTYEYNSSLIETKDKETQDLLHEIELSKFDYRRGNKLVRTLKAVRQDRRRAMDENAALKPLYEYFEGKLIYKDLQRLQQDISKEISKLGSRTYTPRVRDDLTITSIKPETGIKRAFAKAGSAR